MDKKPHTAFSPPIHFEIVTILQLNCTGKGTIRNGSIAHALCMR